MSGACAPGRNRMQDDDGTPPGAPAPDFPAWQALLAGSAAAAELLFEDPAAALLLLDGGGRIRRANRTATALLGPDCAPPHTLIGLLAPAERPRLRAWLDRTRQRESEGGESEEGEPGLGGPEGLALTVGERSLAFSLQPLGRPGDGWLLRATDASSVAALQQELADARRMRTIGQLAGGVAHDFNNLLTAILGAAELVAARPELDGEIADEMDTVRAAALRGQELVRQLLAVGRQQFLQPRPVAVDQALSALAPLLRRLAGPRITLSTELEHPGRPVLIDPAALDRVVVNLVTNGCAAMADGGRLTPRNGHATLVAPRRLPNGESVPPGRWVTLDVIDTGGGIPPELIGRIFEPFVTTRRAGTGLGLATVHGIVRQSGGLIELHSSPAGTEVRLWLPRHAPERLLVVADPPPSAAPVAPATGAGLVLLVEDEPAVRRLAERSLARAGFAVLAVESAEAALAALDRPTAARLAALVSDVVLPGQDGPALLAQLRALRPGLPALLVSGHADAALRQRLDAAAAGFLAKPYRQAELVAAVRALAGGAEMAEQRWPERRGPG